MKTNALAVLFATSMVLAGCAEEGQQWAKDNTPRTEAEQALTECKYQSEAATTNIRTPLQKDDSFGDAIGQGISDGVVRGMEESELVNACMKAKGFSR